MTRRQMLWLVELPLALPTIIAGIRTAAVVGVGIATLSAFIGAGGLGEFINRGLALSNTGLILLGAIPAAMLALIVDGSIAAVQWAVQVRGSASRQRPVVRRVLRPAAFLFPVVVCCVGLYAGLVPGNTAAGLKGRTVRIASKNFTEQLILGEIVAQLIEQNTDIAVDRRFNLGGTMICHEALTGGEIDIYPEYVGTALTAILGEEAHLSAGESYSVVRDTYEERFGCTWLKPFGFENTYALAVSKELAQRRGLVSISDLVPIASTLRAGFPSEFMERPDGYPGLRSTYYLAFSEIRDLDPSLMYQALASGELDVISAFSTDGRIKTYDLTLLEDDRSFFPPYQAALVVREDLFRRFPDLRPLMRGLSGRIDTKTMQPLNGLVDEEHQTPADAAMWFLGERGLIGN